MEINNINAHLPSMADTSDYLLKAYQTLVSDHETLTSQLNALSTDWQSVGSAQYGTAKNEWDRAANNIYVILLGLRNALLNVHDNYVLTDNAIAKQWSA